METVGRHGLIRDLNHRAVYERLAAAGSASRAEIARDLMLSAASVGRVVDALIRAGLVREGERVVQGIGRPQTPLLVNAGAAWVAGVSIRSFALRVHLCDLEGRVVGQVQVPREQGSAQALARQLHDVLAQLVVEHDPTRPLAAVVIGLSAVWDGAARRIYAAPNLAILEDVDALELFRQALADLLLDDTITIDNDINYAALGEAAHGAARGVNRFVYLSVGSGVGGAVIIDGEVQRGIHGFAGEFGYLPVFSGGQWLALEKVIGRTALVRFARPEGLLEEGGDVFEHLEQVDGSLGVVGHHVSDVLVQALAAIITTLDPERIVLGGGVGRYSEAWTHHIECRLRGILPVVPDIVSTAIGRDASLLGAVAHARVLARRTLLKGELHA